MNGKHKCKRLLALSVFLIGIISMTFGQIDEEIDSLLIEEISALVYLDSITITPDDDQLDVDSFVQLVLKDESFYKAFQNLRTNSYSFDHSVNFVGRKNNSVASYEGLHHQTMVNDSCREMSIKSKAVKGKYYKRKNYRYFTSRMIDRVFYSHGTECYQIGKRRNFESLGKFEQQVEKLKILIFKPGRSIDLPLVGEKLNIFDPKMRKYYNYSISKLPHKNNKNAFIFEVAVKPEFIDNKGDIILRNMTTLFDEDNFQVLERKYHLKTKNLLYSFDIEISVNLTKLNFNYIPSFVGYNGFWKLPAKRAEKCTFNFEFIDFKSKN